MQQLTKFKQTEVGKIPLEWSVIPLKEIATKFISGGTPSTSNSAFWGGEIPWIRSARITDKYVYSGEKFITKLGLENSSAKIIPKDNVLVATRVSLGNVAINKIDIAINQDLTGIVVDRSKLSTEYLYWILLKLNHRIKLLSQGSTISGITREDLMTITIPYPPLKEQHGIASVLSKVDELIQKTDQIIEQTQRLKKGLMQQLLTKGIGHTKFKKTLMGEIPEEWNVVKLEDVCSIRKAEKCMSDIYIGLEHISQRTNQLISIGHIKDFTSSKNVFLKGDILYGKLRPLLNKVYLTEKDGYCSTDILPLMVNDKIINKILLWTLTSERFVQYADSSSSGTKMPRTKWNDIKNFVFALGPISEQIRIERIFTNITHRLERDNKIMQYLQILKKGLMQQLLYGKIRVKV
jgi:type I restriction enzyme S subunit